MKVSCFLHLQKYNPIIIVPTFFCFLSRYTCIFTFFLVILHRSRTRKRALLRSNPPATWLCPHWKQCFKSRPAHGRLTDSWWASQLRKPYRRTVSASSLFGNLQGGHSRLRRVCRCKHSNFLISFQKDTNLFFLLLLPPLSRIANPKHRKWHTNFHFMIWKQIPVMTIIITNQL